jgi:hypothetical protein
VPAVFNIAAGDTQGLIDAMATANSNGDSSNVINLTDSTYDLQTVNNNLYGPNGLPEVANNLTIHGNGATIERLSGGGLGTPDFRLFYVAGGMEGAAGSLTMDNATLENGIAKGGDSNNGGGGLGAGGAIFNQGTLILTNVTFTGNEALGGGSGVSTAGNGGGGMGTNSPAGNDDGGGFGGIFNVHSGGGTGGLGGGGGGDGFLLTTSSGGNATDLAPGSGGGKGGFGGSILTTAGDGGEGGQGTANSNAANSGDGGAFGKGGLSGLADSSGAGSGSGGGGGGVGGGGGGVGGGGGAGAYGGGNGGFGGGGGVGGAFGGNGGFGAGSGAGPTAATGGAGGFGGGSGGGNFGGGGAGMGGAIFNMGADSAHPNSGTATLVNCTLAGNTAQGGGGGSSGINALGQGLGGAVFNLDGKITLTNDTLAANHAFLGGDVYNLAYGNDIDTGGTVTAGLVLNNSILANPTSLIDDNDNGTHTATVSGSHNLVTSSLGPINAGVITLTANPLLGPLQNNGGLTPTMLPLSGSPVLGAGDPSLAPSTDQRGTPRPPNGPTDLGSVQLSVAQSPPSHPPGSSAPGSPPTPPSLFQAILNLYIAEVEKDIGFGDPRALRDTIDFNAQCTVIFGINIAPLIEMLADSNVAAAHGGNS